MSDTDFELPRLSADGTLDRARAGTTLVDIRKGPARTNSGETVTGSLLRNPFEFDHSDPLTTIDGPIVVFCVHGHEISQFACALLKLHGRDAYYVSGGFEALVVAGAPTQPIEETAT